MDFDHHHQNTSNSQSQQQYHPSSNIGPDQLPDEKYIEKLFPKCQPKQQQQPRTNQRSNGRYQIASDHQRQQQQQQQQQQQKQQPLDQQRYQTQPPRRQVRSRKTQQLSRRELQARRNGSSFNEMNRPQESHPLQRQKRQVNYNHKYDLKHNRQNHFEPSDSSDENAKNHSKNSVNYKRSATSSSISGCQRINASNSFEPIPSSSSIQDLNHNKGRISKLEADITRSETIAALPSNRVARSQGSGKKFTASKNLQQQLQKTYHSNNQSSLTSVNSNELEFNPSNNDIYSTDQQQNTSFARQCPPIERELSSDQVNRTVAGQVEKNISRTSRGVVFLERREVILSEVISPDLTKPHNQGQTASLDANHTTETGLIDDQVKLSSELTSVSRDSSPQNSHKHPRSGDPADSTQQETNFNDITCSRENKINIDDSIFEPIQHRSESIIEPTLESNGSHGPSVDKVEANDNHNEEDKYIDLFVYDNTPQDSIEKTSLIKEKLPYPNPTGVTNSQNHDEKSDVSSLQYHSSHQLLAVDSSEINVDEVRNDTSIEELCSVNDPPDYAKHFPIKPILKAREIETTTKVPKYDSEPSAAVSTKSILKHHRSLGTLQTVDEKAEISLEEVETTRDRSGSLEVKESSIQDDAMQPKLETTQIKRALVPPGFPQRVRPQSSTNHSSHSTAPLLDRDDNNQVRERPSLDSPALFEAQKEQSDELRIANRPVEKSSDSTIEGKQDKESDISILSQTVDQQRESLVATLDKMSINVQPKNEAIIGNLRHHKLPNESSHFSVSKARNNSLDSEAPCEPAPRSASVHFDNLSDAESDSEQKNESIYRPQAPNKIADKLIKLPSTNTGITKNITSDMTHSSNNMPGSPTSGDFPIMKTALVFPRLDEGLSSEAESCDDDVEDDDDRAMEADVDANDDDEEDDDIDDDLDSQSAMTIDRVPVLQMGTDTLTRQHQSKQNRIFSNMQSSSNQSDFVSQHARSTVPAFSNYSGQDAIDQNDLKSQANYPNQNGPPNYWLNNSTSPATISQPSSSSGQYSVNKGNQILGNGSNNIDNRAVNLMGRDDVKATARLSSDTDNETDRLLGSQRNDQLQKLNSNDSNRSQEQQSAANFKQNTSNAREVLIEGVLFNVKYLGSTHTECEGSGEKEDRINQAEMAVHEVKFRNGDSSSPIEVQLFISTDKIMVLDDKHRKIMMDHSLRTISYIADIGNAIVLIVRKKSTSLDVNNEVGRTIPKTTCHVFESHESHTITKSISQAFQVAYSELLKANGGDPNSYLPKELDYQEVLNSQEMSMTELEMFARKDNQREVIVPKQKGEILGLSIVESGWGSVLPTAVIASLKQDGPAYRCKKLSVGDQILSINGISLVGLSLAECQQILRKTRKQRVARLSVVPCPITVEVKIKRPDTKYQLGFSVQNGVICSLLRGGIAERGGVRVGHRIMSINGTTVVGVPHDKIVTLLASSVGEIRMKTCLTSLYRHMLGEEKAVFL